MKFCGPYLTSPPSLLVLSFPLLQAIASNNPLSLSVNTQKPLRLSPETLHSLFPPKMPAGLDMSLDDIIRRSNRSTGNGVNHRGRGHGGGLGPDRRFVNRMPPRMMPYSVPQPMQVMQSIIPEMGLNGESGADRGTKLYISNLDHGVSNEDIKLLFSEVGELKRYCIHYDQSGRSKGTAEVVFTFQSDALAAIKRYNNMKLDGKPLKIELVGVNLVTHAVMPHFKNGLLRRQTDDFGSGQGRVGGRGIRSGIVHGHIPRGRGQERGHFERLSTEDLDADLERYRLDAMQISKNKN